MSRRFTTYYKHDIYLCILLQVVSVISFVKPWDRAKFLVHLCKSLGSYECEAQLFLGDTIKEAFVKAGLLNSAVNVTREDIMAILRRYVMEDLLFHPISSRQFSRYLKCAVTTMVDLFDGDVLGDYSPTITDVMLKDQAGELLIQEEASRRKMLIDALFDDGALSQHLPAELRDADADLSAHVPRVMQTAGISDAAFAEQQSALACCIRAVDQFLQPNCRGVKFPCLVGRPGSDLNPVQFLGFYSNCDSL